MLPRDFDRPALPGRRTWHTPAALVLLLLALVLTVATLFLPPTKAAEPPFLRVLLASAGQPAQVKIEGTGIGTDRAGAWEGALTLQAEGAALLLPGGRKLEGPLVVSCAGQGQLQVTPPGRAYPERLRVSAREGRLQLVNLVGLENYLPGVLTGELGDAYPYEALCAQAVTARSYALYHCRQRRNKPWDLTDTTRYQVYRGAIAPDRNTARAAAATAGLVLTWEGELLPCWYHSTCGGSTARAARVFPDAPRCPPLAGVTCTACTWVKGKYRWQAGPFAPRRLTSLFDLAGKGRILRLEQADPEGASPWWTRARLVTTTGSATIAATRLRRSLGLKSTRIISFSRTPAGYRIDGGGWGHGVGLCQNGACGMANSGHSWRDILSFYFPVSRVEQVR